MFLWWQKEQLGADGRPASQPMEEFEMDGVSAGRAGGDGAEFCVHWAGGAAKWGSEATTWETLSPDEVLCVWEREQERESALQQLSGMEGQEREAAQQRIALLPLPGSSGIIGRWMSCRIRGNQSRAQVTAYDLESKTFTIQFEQFKVGVNDPDDGNYDLLDAEINWEFIDAPAKRLFE